MGWDDPVGRLADPTEEEFRRWIPYTDVRRYFPKDGPDDAIAAKLYYRLTTGTLYAAGLNAAWYDHNGERHQRWITAIDPRWWSQVGSEGVANAIIAGDVNLTISGHASGRVSVNFLNLRFEWDGIYDALPGLQELLQPAGGPVHRDRPPAPASTAPSRRAPPAQGQSDSEDITAEEYERWRTPSEALASLPHQWPRSTKVQLIASGLEDGLIRAVADEFVTDKRRAERLELPKVVWKNWACLADTLFWDTGYLQVFVDRRDYNGPAFRAYRIRLNPEDLAKQAPTITRPHEPMTEERARQILGAPPAPQVRRVQPPYRARRSQAAPKQAKVTKDELRQWFPSYASMSQDFRADAVREAALAHFSPRPVTRQPVRDIIGEFERTLTRGKPTSL